MSVNISRLERYILYGFDCKHGFLSDFKEEPSVKKRFLRRGFWRCVIMVFGFAVLFFWVLPRIENIDNYPFFLLLLLVPIIAIFTILLCNRSMNSSKWDANPKPSAATKWYVALTPLLGLLLFIFPRDNWIPQGMHTMIVFVLFMFFGLECVVTACKCFHKLYLIRKYAPYFRDERLRVIDHGAVDADTDKPE